MSKKVVKKPNLHVVLKGKLLDGTMSNGNIVLKKSTSFAVSIKEFDEDSADVEKILDSGAEDAKKKFNERAAAGWSQNRLNENYRANMANTQTKLDAARITLKEKYQDVNWVWSLVPRQITAADLTHNESFSKGITNAGRTLNFPEVLEGGGMAYLEAFHENTVPKGTAPYGMLVQAIGIPDILRVEWTDFNYNSLKGKKVKFGSAVLLHIYTKALYGQEVGIYLWDKDVFSPDDSLKIGKDSKFTREVNIHKVLPFEQGKAGVSDKLVKADQPQNANKAEKESFVQKITVQVSVDHFWRAYAGDHLKIYPSIQSNETGEFFQNFTREFLEIADDGILCTSPQPVSNNPAVIGEVETNVNAYHHCQYKAIDYVNDKGDTINIYKEESGVSQNTNIEIGIIAGSDPKKFTFKVDDAAETKDCSFDGKPNDHEKGIFVYDKNKLPSNFVIGNQTQKSIKGTVKFDFDLFELPKYFWLNKNNRRAILNLVIEANTCRHRHHLQVIVVPEVTWAVNFFYNTPDPVWYGQSEPTYDIYGTPSTAVRDNTSIGDIRNVKNRIALAELKKEENTKNKNITGGKTKIATAANRYFGDTKSNFGLSVKATYDGGKTQEISFKFAEKYRKLLGIVKSVYDLADKITGAADARKASETLPSSLAGRRSLMSLSLIPPAPSVGVEWKYSAEKETVGIELAGKVKIAPFIGGDLKIDILALADKIPVYGKLITALDLATWLAEKISFNKLSINYRIDLTFSANLALEEAFIKWNEAKPKGDRLNADLKFSGTFGGKLEISTDVRAKVKTEVEFTFEAGLKAECYFKITASPNLDADNIIDWTTKFSGLVVTGYYKVGIMNKRDKSSRPSEGKFKPFPLIPSYTGAPISMKLGEGTENHY